MKGSPALVKLLHGPVIDLFEDGLGYLTDELRCRLDLHIKVTVAMSISRFRITVCAKSVMTTEAIPGVCPLN